MDAAARPLPAGLAPGAELPALDVGPLALSDFVRWAGYQENWIRMHYDAAFARQDAGLSGPVQSGHHRTALLARMITDWLGARGWLRRLAVRHTGQVRCGETIRCEGRVREVRDAAGGRTEVDLEIWATAGDGRRVSEGSASVEMRA
jgi:acyl dehydratase